MGATSRAGISRPFDAQRDGFVMGEGAGVLVLESETHAKARGAQIYGKVAGYGASNDAFHITQPDADGRGAIRAMTKALERRGRRAGRRRLHQRARHLDAVQRQASRRSAIKGVFGDNGSVPPISSTKSAIGHLLGAAGAVEAVASLSAIERGVAAPDPQPRPSRTPNATSTTCPTGRARRRVCRPCCRTPSGSAARTRPSS